MSSTTIGTIYNTKSKSFERFTLVRKSDTVERSAAVIMHQEEITQLLGLASTILADSESLFEKDIAQKMSELYLKITEG